MDEQENELGAKNEVAAKPETRALHSNLEEDESKATKQKNKMGKTEEAGKSETKSVKEFAWDTEFDYDEYVKAPPKKKHSKVSFMTVKMTTMMMVKIKAKLLGESVNLKLTPIQLKQRSKKDQTN